MAYFDCFCGAAGDMIVGALIDAGADQGALTAAFDRFGLDGYRVSIDAVRKQGFAATRFNVVLDATAKQPHRHLHHVTDVLKGAHLSDRVRDQAIRIFTRLAEAEAAVHGTSVESVHFHEVGAVDAILDVTGAVLALESLGVDRVVCSPIPTGSGTVTCAHGVMPVPAPATAELLKDVPLAACDETGELTTPTGAAVLTTLADEFGPIPPMRIRTIGMGAGTRDGAHRPNVLRVLIGESVEPGGAGNIDEITVLETNIDDATPEVIGHCIDRLFDAGALDVYALPIQMKKSRPGVLLTVLCRPETADALEQTVFYETSTFGIRRHTARRTTLPRHEEAIRTAYGTIRMKVAEGTATASPEYEDCRSAALEHNVPLADVIAAATAAWREHRTG
ncbi:MAG: nickel pincer cofactor biosynthesis protein LarC [Planctomycetes bacterium]|nr:nickel pincer cofactor biosynthesis protein LarC [Planctomycetota bacterium]